ncbi:metallophosphoesterase family protein [Alkalilimnicola sp. S0819]|uniref:metallophosphoesterase family protein n=1 Tax=Alkalilimnicola sp. S0819 TaxID=2613922 RepID=UPI0012624BCC|nr:metallophosphoesterase family protein [Alkalilimnicola sp. S0819]KAB7627528.1 metallophosphoesterase family protein [Alkalilimnicola sp. S0819]MPQ15682.1 YfcE family phosphodiesterase [Alkalilimnicola sp. S0819]
MRVAIVSDTHGFLDPRIADQIAECDLAVHAGDIGGADVLLAMSPRGQLVAVKGNNDSPERWSRQEVHMLETLPEEARLDLPGGQLVVVHGDDAGGVDVRHANLRERYPDARAIVYGHSHRLVVDDSAEPWVLNPGAAGRTRTYGGPSCLVLEADEDGWQVEALRLEPRKYRAI